MIIFSIVSIGLGLQYILCKSMVYNNRFDLSYYIINIIFNFLLSTFGIMGIFYPERYIYGGTIVILQSSAQIINIIYEINEGISLIFFHHILTLFLTNAIILNSIITSRVVCLYGGVCEISALFYSLSYFIHNCPSLTHKYNNLNLFFRLCFALSFLSIRVVWWSLNTPFIVYKCYYLKGYKIHVFVFSLIQLMQYYWGVLIFNKLIKFIKPKIHEKKQIENH